MVDRLKGDTERKLDELFRSEPLPDMDFSKNVMKRVHRQIWIRRLVMPFALMVGGLVAVKPASELIVSITKIMAVLPASITDIPINMPGMPVVSIPQLSMIFVSCAIAVIALFFVRTLAD